VIPFDYITEMVRDGHPITRGQVEQNLAADRTGNSSTRRNLGSSPWWASQATMWRRER
jgi:hypothetical protein